MAAKLKKIVSLCDTDVFCYICRSILIEPVTVPCNHVFCKICFESSLQETSYSCPLCRKRISNWLRSAKKADKLLNSDLWEQIKIQYKDEVNSKLSGQDDGLDERIQHKYRGKQILTPTGQIGQEYSKLFNEYEDQLRRQRAKEEAESLALIKRLQNEEKDEIEESNNVKAALRLQKGTNQTSRISTISSSSKSSAAKNKKRVVGPMDFHIKRLSLAEPAPNNPPGRCGSIESHDSISPEMRHFKPIKIVPKTPPKRSHDGKLKEVIPLQVTPIKNFPEKNSAHSNIEICDICPTVTGFQSSFSAFRGKSSCSTLDTGAPEETVDCFTESGVLKEINLDENSDSNSVGVGKTGPDGKNLEETIAIKIPKLGVPLTDTENLEELYDREEQRMLEERLLQEKADHELALKLSREWGKPYELRRARVPRTSRPARQATLVETGVRRRTK